MKNRIASIALTVVMILGCMITNIDFNVNTVCADPYNIEIRVETKEISIEEIPEDRRVEVEVYASNVPNEDFYTFDIAFKLDKKFGNLVDYCLGVNAISSLSVVAFTENNHLFIESDTIIHSNKRIENGRIYDISIFIPTEVNEGEFYEITPVPDCNNGYDYTSFAFESNKEEIYDSSNFYFIGGGIKIRSSQPEQPTSNDPVPTPDNENYISQNENSNNQSPINNDTNDEITTVTSSETIYSTVSTVSSTKSTTALSPITFNESTKPETKVNVNIEALNTSEVTKEKSSNSNIIRLILVLLCLMIMVVAIMIIFKRRKKDSNDDQH